MVAVSFINLPLNRLFLIVFSIFFTNSAFASNHRLHGQLLDLPIEELMKIEVTTASRRSQKLAEVPAAVFVITQDDIRRSGATSIPEALRMAPGVEVARIGTDKWAINIRGFNGRFAEKLQVLIDGRSVYNPLFSGVLWELQDTLMEDIERIEVIRGPGAAMWGANAVNGVINIITKKASDTQGTLLTAGVEVLNKVLLVRAMVEKSMKIPPIVFMQKDSAETIWNPCKGKTPMMIGIVHAADSE